MIRSPTLLILGAGASAPYGLPLGSRLTQTICALKPTDNVFQSATEASGCRTGEVNALIAWFRESGYGSIDKFLSLENLTETHRTIGKAVMAGVLCTMENPSGLALGDRQVSHWYNELWRVLTDGVTNVGDLKSNQLSIATFNYDRSLEFFLTRRVMATFQCEAVDAWRHLSWLNIVHLYGSLGPFAPGTPDHREYEPTFDSNSIAAAVKSLRVIPEHRGAAEDVFADIRRIATTSERIGFLGFGFDSLNVDRLDLKLVVRDFDGARSYRSILASAKDFTRAQAFAVRAAILGYKHFRGFAVFRSCDGDCTETLRRLALFEGELELTDQENFFED